MEEISSSLEEFIETLSQEFMDKKGYGVYAYLTAADVLDLYEDFKSKNVPTKAFVKTYLDIFDTFDG